MSFFFYFWYAFAIILVAGIPLALAIWLRKRLGSSLRYLFYGAIVFSVVQIIARTPIVRMIELPTDANPLIILGAMALTAGILEELGRYGGFKLFIKKDLKPSSGLMFGLGHGWVESLLVGALMIFTVRSFIMLNQLDTSNIVFTPEQIGEIQAAVEWWKPLLGGLERLFMLPIHMMLSLVVMQSLLSRRIRWLGLAIIIHIAVNFAVGFVMLRLGLIYAELTAMVLAVISVFVILQLIKNYQAGKEPLGSSPGTMTRTG